MEEIPPEHKKDNISKHTHTWDMMENRQKARERNDEEEAKRLDKEIKVQVRKERQEAKIQELEEISEQGYKWEGIKFIN